MNSPGKVEPDKSRSELTVSFLHIELLYFSLITLTNRFKDEPANLHLYSGDSSAILHISEISSFILDSCNFQNSLNFSRTDEHRLLSVLFLIELVGCSSSRLANRLITIIVLQKSKWSLPSNCKLEFRGAARQTSPFEVCFPLLSICFFHVSRRSRCFPSYLTLFTWGQ